MTRLVDVRTERRRAFIRPKRPLAKCAIPAGILGGAHVNAVAPGPSRFKWVTQNGGTSITATFDEPTALDSTYLLVAMVVGQTVDVSSTPSGWTAASGGGTFGILYTRVYARQGNSSVNSITVSFTGTLNTGGVVILLAFPGFVSASSLASNSGTNNVSPGLQNMPAPSTTPAASNGVVLDLIGAVGSMQNARTVSNGFTLLTPLPTSPTTMEYQSMAGWKQYIGSGGSYTSTFDWGSTVSYLRYQVVVYQLA